MQRIRAGAGAAPEPGGVRIEVHVARHLLARWHAWLSVVVDVDDDVVVVVIDGTKIKERSEHIYPPSTTEAFNR